MPKPRHLLILLLVILAGGLIVAAFRSDGWVRDSIVAAQGKGWKKSGEARTIGAISKYGDWPQLMILGTLGSLLAWRLRRREWTRILVAAMVASTLAGILANTSRLTTGRVRPRDEKKQGVGFFGPFHEGKILVGNSKYNAFPSGHTATAVGFAGVIFIARPLIGIVPMLLALLIAWSRMALGAHHLSDVVVSTILALGVAWFVWKFARSHGDRIASRIAARLTARLRRG